MSYLRPASIRIAPSQLRRPRARARGLGGLYDDIGFVLSGPLPTWIGLGPAASTQNIEDAIAQSEAAGQQDIADCLTGANASVASLDAQINDLTANWHPSGFYTPAQVQQVIQMGLSIIKQGQQAILDGIAANNGVSSDVTSQLADAQDQLDRYGQQAADITTTLNPKADLVEADGLRRWAIGAMQVTRDALTASAVTSCLRPTWVAIMGAVEGAFASAVAVLKLLGNELAQAGQVIQKLPDTIGTIYAVLKYKKYKSKRS